MDIKDPSAFRALAHPLRLELFERLAILGTATASELADLVDESPANCSFHLRVLAKHGYIERAESDDGRSRPWRVTDVSQHWDADLSEDTKVAADALEDALIEWDTLRMRQAARIPRPAAWKGKLFDSRATLWLTPQEAEALADQLRACMQPYVDRWYTDERPEAGAPVRLLMSTFLIPGHHESAP